MIQCRKLSGAKIAAVLAGALAIASCGTQNPVAGARPSASLPQGAGPAFDPIADNEIQTILSEDAIQAIQNPTYLSAASAADIRDAEEVMGVAINGEARAFPTATLSVHEIINDTIGGQPVAISW